LARERFTHSESRFTNSGQVIDALAAQVEREVELQAHLVHPHILRAYAYFQDAQYLYIVLEHAAQGGRRSGWLGWLMAFRLS